MLAGNLASSPEQARELFRRAMQAVHDTHVWRRDDWLNAPMPEFDGRLETEFRPERAQAVYQQRIDRWEERLQAAQENDILHERPQAIKLATTAVRLYGHSYDQAGRAAKEAALRDLTNDYEGSPIADLAQAQLDKVTAE